MTRLSERVRKAKQQLQFREIPGSKALAVTGSKNDPYQLYPSWGKTVTWIADEPVEHKVLQVSCRKLRATIEDKKPSTTTQCRGNGNGHKTVCYHVLGAVCHWSSKENWKVKFCDSIFSAITALNLGGELLRVDCKESNGSEWAIISQKQITLEERTNLLRGTEAEQNGID